MSLRILTNIERLNMVEAENVEIDLICAGDDSIRGAWRLFKRSFQYDFVVIECDIKATIRQGLFRRTFRVNPSFLVAVDTVLPVPKSISEKIKAAFKRFCLREVALFIEYFKNTKGVEQYYGVESNKFRYVPFKISEYEAVLSRHNHAEIGDDAYIFSGGNTRRDFGTLLRAAEQLSYPVKIVTMPNSIIQQHGSTVDEQNIPDNVEVIRHDGSNTFLDYIARCRLAVVPIKRDNITASGISVYLACMALRKCVIISEGPSVDDIISDQAIVVPAEDVEALRKAIITAYENEQYRHGFANRGFAYAMSLGDERRLYESIIRVLIAERISNKNITKIFESGPT